MSKVIARRIEVVASGESSYVKGFHPHPFHRAMIHMGYKPANEHGSHRELVHEAKHEGFHTAYTHPSVHGVIAVKHKGRETHLAKYSNIGGNVSQDHNTKVKNHDHLHAWHDSYVHAE